MIIAKKGKNINPNIVINDTVTTFIGITKLSGFAIILNANIVDPDKTIFFNNLYIFFMLVLHHIKLYERTF